MAWRAKAWLRLTGFAVVFGLASDLFNVVQQYRLSLRSKGNGPIVFEDFTPTGLPECAFAAPSFKEEAEPDWWLNFFDWATGIGPAEESAYSNAERKIQRNVLAPAKSPDVNDTANFGDSTTEVSDRQESTEIGGLQIIRKKFYFDEHGYHAQVVMGSLRTDLTKALELGCETQSERGNIQARTYSREFTCNTLDRIIEEEIERANTSSSIDKCTVSLRFKANFQTRRIVFDEEIFAREPHEASGYALSMQIAP
jgi:hypothetical protein